MWEGVSGTSQPVEEAVFFLSLTLWTGHFGASADKSGAAVGSPGNSSSGKGTACSQRHTLQWTQMRFLNWSPGDFADSTGRLSTNGN